MELGNSRASPLDRIFCFPCCPRVLQKLITTTDNEKTDEICISDIPGGAAAFEICAKFCYGMTVTLNAHNVTAARCAAEYLNARNKSVASKASTDAFKVEWSYTDNRKKLPSENCLETHWKGIRKENSVPKDWWVEDLCELEIGFFKKIIMAIKAKGRVSSEVIGEALKAYTYRRFSSLGKEKGGDANKTRSLLETIILLLPSEKGSVSCCFLLKLLRAGSLLDCGETSKRELVKRIGRQLEDASVPGLLIPSTSGENTIYDVDMVLNIVEEFIMQDNSDVQLSTNEELHELNAPALAAGISKVTVAKLVDDYLIEVAKDPNLPLSKFIDLAEILPSDSRPEHDGLYHAIDTYLKEHPGLSKSEKKKLCGLMNCKKLSGDACAHAMQNERLPLRLVVQILYFEQMRASAATTSRAESGNSYGSSRSAITTNTEDECDGVPNAHDGKARKFTKLSEGGKGCEWSSGGNNENRSNGQGKSGSSQVKGVVMPKKMLGKFLSSKGQTGSSSSPDTSAGSPNSAKQGEPKLTPSRNIRSAVIDRAVDERSAEMSCNGCRVLRKGCSDSCLLRPCLQWIDFPEAQAHATVFVAKFFGRAGLMSFISGVPPQRPALFKSLLFEACGRTINPVNGAVGLMWTGNWHLCQAAVETVLRGGTLSTLPGLATEDHSDDAPPESDGLCSPPLMGFSSAAKRWKVPAPYDAAAALSCDLDLCLSLPRRRGEEKRSWRPATPSINSEGSVTTSGGGGSTAEPRLLNLFV
ncbi:BTB POZ domain-containing protein [Musa troglodytarum]|uniref:BTB POZ domain-containing protein n=1 Tax=Musa troglodytarum TaxID=320322 RepID=A0A9E7GLM5_9LILI|nr:BTB POZ domain-containing protein [Musa troglodytarum]URE15273.1 BTB POZ domain-containing protein [Musa troglodytarum]URE15275.1 BTB POZ domain-containing protein [Musa troglodytarum]